jgi:hypothetical protein
MATTRKPAGKLDLYKEPAAEYVRPKTPALVTIKPALYLSIAGRGAPSGEAFNTAVGALYGAAFTIKMASKFRSREGGRHAEGEGKGGSAGRRQTRGDH